MSLRAALPGPTSLFELLLDVSRETGPDQETRNSGHTTVILNVCALRLLPFYTPNLS